MAAADDRRDKADPEYRISRTWSYDADVASWYAIFRASHVQRGHEDVKCTVKVGNVETTRYRSIPPDQTAGLPFGARDGDKDGHRGMEICRQARPVWRQY